MGQIVGLKAKPKRCNLNALGDIPTPAAGEHILVSSDNSMTANGQGNFDCYVVGDGTTAATALELKNVETLIGVFDISSYHATGGVLAKYADLTAALNDGNNIPQSFRKGGMSVKFVQSSDNKYVQYRCIADEFITDVEKWAVCDDSIYVESPEYVYVKTDGEGKILWGIKIDGGIYYGTGCPQQVKDYIEEKISSLSLDEYEDIVAFLSDYLGGDTTLKAIIDGITVSLEYKLDAEGLDPDALETVQAVENPEYIQVTTDSENKILEGITPEGVKQINLPIDTPSVVIEHVDNPEFIQVTTDAEGKVIDGIRKDGTKVEPCNVEYPNGIPSGITEYVENRIEQTSRHIAPFNSVPEYYFDNNYLDNKIETINKIASKEDTDTFIFITDEHFERNAQVSPIIINYLEKKTLFSKIISAGDHVHLVNETGKAEINKAAFDFIYSFNHCSKSPFYPAIGNHEFLTGRFQSGTFDGVELWKWAYYLYYTNLNGISLGDKEKMYYYLDDNVKKMRYIFLSAYTPYENEIPEGEGYQRVATSAYDDAQIQWFRDVALNVEEGYGIIIITHELAGITAGNQQSDDNLTISCGSYLYKRVANVILNYHGSGTIICVLAGHTHRDGIVLFDDEFVGNTGESVTNNAFFQITSTCDANDFTGMASEMLVNRESGTINEGAFDFCIINRVEEKLNLIRIGAKTDINYHYTGTIEEREINFGVKTISVGEDLTLNNDLQGTVTWQSKRENIATVSNGTVHGISSGFVQISASNSTKAIVYLIKVN